MDQITATQQRLSFAKICIELEACQEVPNTVEVRLRDGSLASILVEVPWRPMKCLACNIFGHSNKDCLQKPKVIKTWVPKQSIEKILDDSAKEDQVVLKLDK